jgi:hypothetical protein
VHDHAGCIARQTPGRFRGNARAAVEDRLSGRVGACKDRRIDMDDHLISLARRAGIDPSVQPRGIFRKRRASRALADVGVVS